MYLVIGIFFQLILQKPVSWVKLRLQLQHLKMQDPSQIEHALYMFTRTLPKYAKENFLNLKLYTDGLPFFEMLSQIEYFRTTASDLEEAAEKWTQKLSNLKRILKKMEQYVEQESRMKLKTDDLEIVELAKNCSSEEIFKYFEVVIAVLMQTPEKEEYIQTIMDLDERSQQALVVIVQNAMEFRIQEQQASGTSKRKVESLLNENHIFAEEINQLCRQTELLTKQKEELKEKVQELQDELEKAKSLNIEMYMNSRSEEQHENKLVETLKAKILSMNRQHELELAKANEEVYQIKTRLIQSKQVEQELLERNKLLENKLKNEAELVETGRKKFEKMVEEKDSRIRKLQYELDISKNKIRELSEDIQVNDLNLRMEMEKKQIRYRQLQKEVKTRLTQSSDRKCNLHEDSLQKEAQEEKEEELEYLKNQVDKLRTSNRQLERENLKMKKKAEKLPVMEAEKKKLEKLILEVSKCRDSQIQMLVVSLYDLRNENVRMHEILRQLKTKYENKLQ